MTKAEKSIIAKTTLATARLLVNEHYGIQGIPLARHIAPDRSLMRANIRRAKHILPDCIDQSGLRVKHENVNDQRWQSDR